MAATKQTTGDEMSDSDREAALRAQSSEGVVTSETRWIFGYSDIRFLLRLLDEAREHAGVKG